MALVRRLMSTLSEKALASLVKEHRSVVAEAPVPTAKKIHQCRRFLFSKDPPWPVKKSVVAFFFCDWCYENHGMGVVETMRRERQMPHGLFVQFVRCHTVLKHHCTEGNKFYTRNNPRYIACLKRYQSALAFYSKQYPLEFDDISPLSRSVVDG